MSRLCRLKTAKHGDDGKWAHDEIVRLREENSRLSDLCDKWNSELDDYRVENRDLANTLQEALNQRDDLLAALEQFATWGRMQHKAQSKGCHATFDMLALKDEIDLAEAAIASVKGSAA